jgi:predicted secreted hydrolase
MRRSALALALFTALFRSASAAPPDYPTVSASPALEFPRDHAAHPAFRTEWWYLTGWLDDGDGAIGFQVTFFRSRPPIDQDNPSAFAAKQVMMAHAALSDPKLGRLIHDQRVARTGFGLAELSDSRLGLSLEGWTWKGLDGDAFSIDVPADGFTLSLTAAPTQPLLPEGPDGVSAKGGGAASRYYSEPHLAITADLERAGRRQHLTGEAWFDHEWSSTLLPGEAVGWDWAALDLRDGGALMAFRIRDAEGRTLSTGGTWRGKGEAPLFLPDQAVRFEPRRRWRSPHSGADYPVESDLEVIVAGERHLFALKPLLDDQELDSRLAGGPIYWEGAVSCAEGRGYLELTGYDKAIKF